jgi:hypothetical protein
MQGKNGEVTAEVQQLQHVPAVRPDEERELAPELIRAKRAVSHERLPGAASLHELTS